MPQEPDARHMTANLRPPARGHVFAIPGRNPTWCQLRLVEHMVTHERARA